MNIFGPFGRFLIVGGSVSLSYAVITAGLINFAGTQPFAPSVIVYLFCIPIAFWLQKRFAFAVKKTRKSAFLIYAATQIGSLAVVSAVTTAFIFHDFIKDTALMLITAGCAAVISFLIAKFVAFKPLA
jgi:putative flippase GtrA